MLRNRIVNGQKASDATYVAHKALVRGMAVVKGTDGKTAFVAEATDAGVFLVDRDNLPVGVECAYADRPDSAFDKIVEGDLIKLVPYVNGESFYTDQYDAGAEVAGTALGAGLDGKWEALAGGTKYVSRGTETVAGKVMLVVEVIA